MAKPSDLERVRSAIEALNSGTIAYSEFDSVVASVVAAGSMTREDVRHELEAALMAENVRRDPSSQTTAELRVPPPIVRRARPSRPAPDRARGASRPWVGRILAGIAALALIGAFVGFMIPRLQLDGGSLKNTHIPPAPTEQPANDVARNVLSVEAVPPAQASTDVPIAEVANQDVPNREVTNQDVPVPSRVSAAALVSQPSPPASPQPQFQAQPEPPPSPDAMQRGAPMAAMPTAVVMRQENPDSPPANSQNSPHLHVAQGYETFADLCPYPRMALAHGETGKVGLLAYVAPDGHVLNTAIVNSSGSEDLDVAASMCLKEKGHFVPKIAGGRTLGYWGRMTFNWSFGE